MVPGLENRDLCGMVNFVRFGSAFYGDKNRINVRKSRLLDQRSIDFPVILDDLVTHRVVGSDFIKCLGHDFLIGF